MKFCITMIEEKGASRFSNLLKLSALLEESPNNAVLRKEISQESRVLERQLLTAARFPKASERDTALVDFAEILMQNWNLTNRDRQDAKNILEFLYKVATKTYHSQKLLRYLLTIHCSLRYYADAERIFRTYMELVEKAKLRVSKGSVGVELDDPQMISIAMAEGINMLIHDLKKYEDARDAADLLKKWTSEFQVQNDDAKFHAVAWFAIGNAYGYLSRNTAFTEQRTDLENTAKEAYLTSLSFDPENFDSLFEGALLLAETQKIISAEELVQKAIKIDKTHIQSQHLYVLILTCQEKYDEARLICKEVAVFNKETNGRVSLEQRIMLLEIKKTEIAILEAQGGPQKSIGCSLRGFCFLQRAVYVR